MADFGVLYGGFSLSPVGNTEKNASWRQFSTISSQPHQVQQSDPPSHHQVLEDSYRTTKILESSFSSTKSWAPDEERRDNQTRKYRYVSNCRNPFGSKPLLHICQKYVFLCNINVIYIFSFCSKFSEVRSLTSSYHHGPLTVCRNPGTTRSCNERYIG